MQIEVTTPEVLAHEPYQPTDSPNVFVNVDTGSTLILEGEIAYRVTTK